MNDDVKTAIDEIANAMQVINLLVDAFAAGPRRVGANRD